MALRGRRRGIGQPGEWFYCLKHQKAEEGPECPSKNRMGPYPSREEAERALAIVAERNEEWDADPRGTDDSDDSDAREP